MAIVKQDCLLLLHDLNKMGVETKNIEKILFNENSVSLEVLDFINKNRPLDVASFYEKIRKSYNTKKSKLYKNLMTEINENNINEILSTLNSYALQICLFAKNIKDKKMFYRFTRLDEVYKCLYHYTQSYDLIPCIKLLAYIRNDIKVLETIYREKKSE